MDLIRRWGWACQSSVSDGWSVSLGTQELETRFCSFRSPLSILLSSQTPFLRYKYVYILPILEKIAYILWSLENYFEDCGLAGKALALGLWWWWGCWRGYDDLRRSIILEEPASTMALVLSFMFWASIAYALAECQEGLRTWSGVRVPVTLACRPPAGNPGTNQHLFSTPSSVGFLSGNSLF